MASAFAGVAQVATSAQSASRCWGEVLTRAPGVAMAASVACSDHRTVDAREHASRNSHRQDNLAEMLVLAHMRLRRHRFIEREAAVDRQLELAGGHRIPQIGTHAAADLAHLLERTGAKGHADIVDAPQG